jgi:membrane protein DedA with SNARE-associated domain
LFDQFTQLVSDASGWAYAIIVVLAFLDALVPVVPSESSVITAGVVASSGDLSVPLVILAAAAGAFAGDNTAYLLGRRFGTRIEARFFRGDRGQKQIQWAERQLAERGGELIVIGRFIPGGRTAVTLSAGTLAYPWRRFALFDAAAALVWAFYATLLGYFGGRAFEDAPWKGLLLALGIAFAVAGAIEMTRRLHKRRRRPGAAASQD